MSQIIFLNKFCLQPKRKQLYLSLFHIKCKDNTGSDIHKIFKTIGMEGAILSAASIADGV